MDNTIVIKLCVVSKIAILNFRYKFPAAHLIDSINSSLHSTYAEIQLILYVKYRGVLYFNTDRSNNIFS